MSAIQELHSGAMYKCGGKVKSWNKRSFILKSDSHLYYYKGISRIPVGNISLHDPKFKVRKGEPTDIVWPKISKSDCRMAVVTTTRTYFMYTNYSHEIEEWLEVLSKAAVEANKDVSGGAKPGEYEECDPLSSTIQPGEYEECDPTVMSAAGSIESEYSLISEVQSIDQEYIEIGSPPTPGTVNQESDLYEAMADNLNQDIYDSVSEVTSYPHTTSGQSAQPLPQRNPEASSSPPDEQNLIPPLPEREPQKSGTSEEDAPPLPDKEEYPPLPDKEDCPPLPDKEENPPLPDKEKRPPLPDKEENPPLPDKEERPPLPDKDECPPLPDKEERPSLSAKEENLPLPEVEDSEDDASLIPKNSPEHHSQTPEEFPDKTPDDSAPPQGAEEESTSTARRDSRPVPRPRTNTNPGKPNVATQLVSLNVYYNANVKPSYYKQYYLVATIVHYAIILLNNSKVNSVD